MRPLSVILCHSDLFVVELLHVGNPMLTEPSSARVPHVSFAVLRLLRRASWREPLSAVSVLLSSRDSDIVGCSGLAVGAGCPAGPVRHARSTPTVPDPPARHCRARPAATGTRRCAAAAMAAAGHTSGYIDGRWRGRRRHRPGVFCFVTLARVPVFATSREVATSRDGTHDWINSACGQLR